jgi:hypothetical protein
LAVSVPKRADRHQGANAVRDKGTVHGPRANGHRNGRTANGIKRIRIVMSAFVT